jgi:hypothetical protein
MEIRASEEWVLRKKSELGPQGVPQNNLRTRIPLAESRLDRFHCLLFVFSRNFHLDRRSQRRAEQHDAEDTPGISDVPAILQLDPGFERTGLVAPISPQAGHADPPSKAQSHLSPSQCLRQEIASAVQAYSNYFSMPGELNRDEPFESQ